MDCEGWNASEHADALLCKNYMSLDNTYQSKQFTSYREYMFVPSYYKSCKDFCQENEVLWPMPSCPNDTFVIGHRGANNSGVHRHSPDAFLLEKRKECTKSDITKEDGTCCAKEYQPFNNLSKRKSSAVFW